MITSATFHGACHLIQPSPLRILHPRSLSNALDAVISSRSRLLGIASTRLRPPFSKSTGSVRNPRPLHVPPIFHNFVDFISIGRHCNFIFANSENKLSEKERERHAGSDPRGSACSRCDDGLTVTAVLMGWLGAKQKHLMKYAELYAPRGIRTVVFMVSVSELIGFDLGKGLERRIEALVQELTTWLSDTEDEGTDRGLLFHAFSNTGWFAYGAVLDNLQQKGDFMKKIKGCIIDSGGDAEISPQVWASGFAAALLQKCSLLTCSSVEESSSEDFQKSKPFIMKYKCSFIEAVLLSSLEVFFSIFLRLPSVNQRLSRILHVLTNAQPLCLQLYLYSTADRVILAQSVESFIRQQQKSGRRVWAYNFWSSPHVNHYRSFPHIYAAALHKFLNECMS